MVRSGWLTVGRASALVAALCLVVIVLALGATQVAEKARPGNARLDADLFAPLRLPKLDVHQRVGPATLDAALRVARVSGIGALVNLSGGTEGGLLEVQLAAAHRHRERVIVFMNLDLEGCCGEGWAAREAARLARGQALGARGLAIVDEPPGARLDLDRAEPLWEACAELGLPVALGEVGTPEGRIRLVERHPRVDFIGGHFWEGARDPGEVSRLMDRLPNLWVDTAGLPELGSRAEVTRQVILAHPDRVLFGSDVRYLEQPVERGAWQGIVLGGGQPILLDPNLLGGEERRVYFASTFRFFETRDAAIPIPVPGGVAWSITGIGLAREVLRGIYHRNAERLLRVRTPEVEE